MSKESQAFLRELHNKIDYWTTLTIDAVTGSESIIERGNLGISEEDVKALRKVQLTPEQVLALKKALTEMGRGVVFGLLCIIDGVAYTESEDIPDLALVNRATAEDLSDQFLHDEFYEVAPE